MSTYRVIKLASKFEKNYKLIGEDYQLYKLASKFEKRYNIKLGIDESDEFSESDDSGESDRRTMLPGGKAPVPGGRRTLPGLGIDPNPEDRFTEVMGLPIEPEKNLLYGEKPSRKEMVESNSLAWIKDDEWISKDLPALKLVYVLQSGPQLSIIEEQKLNPNSNELVFNERRVLTEQLRKYDTNQPVYVLSQDLRAPVWNGIPDSITRRNIICVKGRIPLYRVRKLW